MAPRKGKNLKGIKEHLPLLKHIHHCAPKDRQIIAKGLNNDVVGLICRICVNLQNKNVPVTNSKALKKLTRYKKELVAVTTKPSISKTRKIIQQKGGFLAPVLGIAIPFLAKLLGGLFHKK